MPQVGAVCIQHQAGGQDVAGLRLDHPAYGLQDVGERLTLGDHLEHAFLPNQQGLAPLQGRLGLLAVLDVGRRARPVHEVSPRVAHRHRTQEAPAVRAIATSEACCLLPRLSRGEGVSQVSMSLPRSSG